MFNGPFILNRVWVSGSLDLSLGVLMGSGTLRQRAAVKLQRPPEGWKIVYPLIKQRILWKKTNHMTDPLDRLPEGFVELYCFYLGLHGVTIF